MDPGSAAHCFALRRIRGTWRYRGGLIFSFDCGLLLADAPQK
jgi:hypothetical protein